MRAAGIQKGMLHRLARGQNRVYNRDQSFARNQSVTARPGRQCCPLLETALDQVLLANRSDIAVSQHTVAEQDHLDSTEDALQDPLFHNLNEVCSAL
jgi:hypothetical protein